MWCSCSASALLFLWPRLSFATPSCSSHWKWWDKMKWFWSTEIILLMAEKHVYLNKCCLISYQSQNLTGQIYLPFKLTRLVLLISARSKYNVNSSIYSHDLWFFQSNLSNMTLINPTLTGSQGPSWVCLHPEGREGSDQDGGDHGARLLGVLDAICLLCSLGCEQPWAVIRSEICDYTVLFLKGFSSLQPCYLCGL